MVLSVCFLVFVMACAMAKTVPSMAWTVLSWCQFKDPDRLRPFYILEKERRRIEKGKLKCDVGYYAQRVGLECHESQVETEDGFILTIQHIVDRTPGAIDAKSTHEVQRRLICRQISCSVDAWIDAVIWSLLRQRREFTGFLLV